MAFVIDYENYEDFDAQYESAKSKKKEVLVCSSPVTENVAAIASGIPFPLPPPVVVNVPPTFPKQSDKPKTPEPHNDAPPLKNKMGVSAGPGGSIPTDANDGQRVGDKLGKAIAPPLEQAAKIGPPKSVENTTDAKPQAVNQIKTMQKQVTEAKIEKRDEKPNPAPEADKKKLAVAASNKSGKKSKTASKAKKSVTGKRRDKESLTPSSKDVRVKKGKPDESAKKCKGSV